MFRRNRTQNEQQKQRQKQIAEFKRLNPTAISRADGRNFQLVLNACRALPDEFPAKAPVVSVSVDNLQHPWIDRQGRVQGHPHLDNWNSHCVLGNIIRNVVSEFMSNPPRVGGDQSPAQAEPVQRQQQAASDVESNRIALSPIPEKFDELDALSEAKLRELASDQHSYVEFLENLSIYKGVSTLYVDVQKNVLELAKKNLAREQEVKELKQQLNDLEETAKAEAAALEKLVPRQQKVLQKYSVSNLALLMSERAEAHDQASEDIRHKFVDGDMDENAFVKQYVKSRTEFHHLMALRERLIETRGPT